MKAQISDRQLEIIEATGKILTTSGVSGLTIKNLAKEMKFTEGAIYKHFKSKEEILITMLEYLSGNMEKRYTRIISDTITPEENIKELFKDQFSFFAKNPHFVVAVFTDGFMEESEKINEAILKIMSIRQKYMKPLIEQGQNENSFTNIISTEETLHILMGSTRLLMYKWRVSNFKFNLKEKGSEMVESVFKLIRINK